MLNRIILIGRLTRDPELRYTGQGTPVTTLRIAVDRPKSKDGEKQTDFIDVVAWRQSAEFAANYLTKGRLISVDGRLQTRTWVAQDGTKRWSSEVVADNIQGLDRPRTDGGEPAPPPDAPPEAGEMEEEGGGDYSSYDDPFQDQ